MDLYIIGERILYNLIINKLKSRDADAATIPFKYPDAWYICKFVYYLLFFLFVHMLHIFFILYTVNIGYNNKLKKRKNLYVKRTQKEQERVKST